MLHIRINAFKEGLTTSLFETKFQMSEIKTLLKASLTQILTRESSRLDCGQGGAERRESL